MLKYLGAARGAESEVSPGRCKCHSTEFAPHGARPRSCKAQGQINTRGAWPIWQPPEKSHDAWAAGFSCCSVCSASWAGWAWSKASWMSR